MQSGQNQKQVKAMAFKDEVAAWKKRKEDIIRGARDKGVHGIEICNLGLGYRDGSVNDVTALQQWRNRIIHAMTQVAESGNAAESVYDEGNKRELSKYIEEFSKDLEEYVQNAHYAFLVPEFDPDAEPPSKEWKDSQDKLKALRQRHEETINTLGLESAVSTDLIEARDELFRLLPEEKEETPVDIDQQLQLAGKVKGLQERYQKLAGSIEEQKKAYKALKAEVAKIKEKIEEYRDNGNDAQAESFARQEEYVGKTERLKRTKEQLTYDNKQLKDTRSDLITASSQLPSGEKDGSDKLIKRANERLKQLKPEDNEHKKISAALETLQTRQTAANQATQRKKALKKVMSDQTANMEKVHAEHLHYLNTALENKRVLLNSYVSREQYKKSGNSYQYLLSDPQPSRLPFKTHKHPQDLGVIGTQELGGIGPIETYEPGSNYYSNFGNKIYFGKDKTGNMTARCDVLHGWRLSSETKYKLAKREEINFLRNNGCDTFNLPQAEGFKPGFSHDQKRLGKRQRRTLEVMLNEQYDIRGIKEIPSTAKERKEFSNKFVFLEDKSFYYVDNNGNFRPLPRVAAPSLSRETPQGNKLEFKNYEEGKAFIEGLERIKEAASNKDKLESVDIVREGLSKEVVDQNKGKCILTIKDGAYQLHYIEDDGVYKTANLSSEDLKAVLEGKDINDPAVINSPAVREELKNTILEKDSDFLSWPGTVMHKDGELTSISQAKIRLGGATVAMIQGQSERFKNSASLITHKEQQIQLKLCALINMASGLAQKNREVKVNHAKEEISPPAVLSSGEEKQAAVISSGREEKEAKEVEEASVLVERGGADDGENRSLVIEMPTHAKRDKESDEDDEHAKHEAKHDGEAPGPRTPSSSR